MINPQQTDNLNYFQQDFANAINVYTNPHIAPMNQAQYYPINQPQNIFILPEQQYNNIQQIPNQMYMPNNLQQFNEQGYDYPAQSETSLLKDQQNEALQQFFIENDGVQVPLKEKNEENKNNQIKEQKPLQNVIVHEIKTYDTLMGLELQYNVPANVIRKFNNLTSDDIYFYKTIKIPNPKSNIEPDADEEEAQKYLKLKIFKGMLTEEDRDCVKTAKYYLEDAQYDVDLAFKNYKADLTFEKQAKLAEESLKDKNIHNKHNNMQYKYNEIELINKKLF